MDPSRESRESAPVIVQASSQVDDAARVGATPTANFTAGLAVPPSSSLSFSSGGGLNLIPAPRPRRSWGTASSVNIEDCSTATATAHRPQPTCVMSTCTSAGEGEVGESAMGAAAAEGAGERSRFSSSRAEPVADGSAHCREDLTDVGEADVGSKHRDMALLTRVDAGSSFPRDTSPFLALPSSSRGGASAADDDLTGADESVLARLAEFTELARQTAVHKEELSLELADQKRRGAHTTRKLEQSNMTCAELRESLALAQETVVKLREHEKSWAESTASEMSLRAEMSTLKDENADISANASVLRKHCELLERENTELGERLAAVAEEKRQVECRARKLLRSDRYRGF